MDTWNTPSCETEQQDFNCYKKDKMVTLSNENSAQTALTSCDISRPHDIGTHNNSNRKCCSS